MKWTFILFAIAAVTYQPCNGYQILGVFHTMARSHAIVAQGIMKSLAEAGHNVTVLSAFPLAKKIPNYHDVEISGMMEFAQATVFSKNMFDMTKNSPIESVAQVYQMGIDITNFTLSNDGVKRFLRSEQKFDVVITEIFLNEAMLGIGHLFNAPVIGVSTFGASKWSTDLVGSPSPLSYVPHTFLSFTPYMSFVQRFGNTMMSIFETAYMNLYYYPFQREIYEKTFPNPKPSMDEVMKDVSLVLLNTHFTLSFPRPYVPNMIEIGGIQIDRKKQNVLPDDLKTYIDNSKNGVVYFSMGSNLKSIELPEEKRDALLRSFAKLKQNVIWKWEDDKLPGKPDNVLIQKWLPQEAILANPNVKLFITHGGLLSTTEATYYGKPIIGIPIFGDQLLNMARTQNAGYGLTVNYDNLTETSISWALNEMLSNGKYLKNAKIVAERYRDQPMTPQQIAVYWVEYVCRHKGAPHLHSPGQDLTWLAYHNLDVFGLLAFIILFVLYIVGFLVAKCICAVKSMVTPKSKSKLKKK